MKLTRPEKLARARARDRAFDGRFITGVMSTGIYCLPSCGARRPNPENVRFFEDEPDARRAGLRPCKRCRPDLFYRDRDPELELARELARRVRTAPGDFADTTALARAGGVGVTALGRLFRRHYHEGPGGFLTRARVAAAVQGLIAGRRIVDVALDAGFESSSAFHENLRRHTGMSPGAWQRLDDGAEMTLALPRDFRLRDTLASLGREVSSQTDRVEDARFVRALLIDGRTARLTIDLGPRQARCRVEPSGPIGPRGMAAAHAVAWRLLGLQTDPGPFERRNARAAAPLRALARRRPGLRIPQTPTLWEGVCWTIVGQQVNLRFAAVCRDVLIRLAGRRAGDGLMTHPTPREVARLDHADLTRRQFSRRKAEYVIDTARRIASGELDLEALRDASAIDTERRLLAVRGLGPWSINYVLMRSCGYADCVPVGDAGLVAALARFYGLAARPGPDDTRELMAPFAPYRSLASFHLWRMLGDPE